ncbi:MAG: hypothetical protein RIF41_07385 [Polyangiaceae bacterium]
MLERAMTPYRSPGDAHEGRHIADPVPHEAFDDELTPLVGQPRDDVDHDDRETSALELGALLACVVAMGLGLHVAGHPVIAFLLLPQILCGLKTLVVRIEDGEDARSG